MNPWLQTILVFLGAGLGGVSRFWLALLVSHTSKAAGDTGWKAVWVHMPMETILVNVLGSFAIGLVSVWAGKEVIRLWLIVGFLGGFTTFSSFSLQTLELWQHGNLTLALLNVLLSVVICLLVVAGGYALGKTLAPV